MNEDKEIAKKVLNMQAKGSDYSLVELPGFLEWANRISAAGGNEAAIGHMLAMSMFLLPEEVSSVSETDFEEIYDDIVSGLD